MTHDEEERLLTLDTLASESPMQLIHTMVYLCGGVHFVVRLRGVPVTHDEEEKLWTLDTLRSENPMQLIHTMMYLCGGVHLLLLNGGCCRAP